jgi:hypothetical protein
MSSGNCGGVLVEVVDEQPALSIGMKHDVTTKAGKDKDQCSVVKSKGCGIGMRSFCFPALIFFDRTRPPAR